MTVASGSLPKLLILGAGGHGRVVADAALRQGAWRVVEATDRDPARCSGELIAGVSRVEPRGALAGAEAVHVAIGDGRARQAEAATQDPQSLSTVVHPQASVSPHSSVGPGCFVAAQAVVAPGAWLGAGVIVNHGAVVDHDCEVGSFSHVAPQAALGGGVRIGDRVLVGTGACVLPGIRICDDVTVGAGSVVRSPITQPGVYAGVPARRIR